MSTLARLFCPPVVPVEQPGGDRSPKHVLRMAEAYVGGAAGSTLLSHVAPLESAQERGASAAGGRG